VFRLPKCNDTRDMPIDRLDLRRQHEYRLSLRVHHFDGDSLCAGQGDCIIDIFDRCLIGDLVDLSFDITTMKVSIENVRGTKGLKVR